MVIVSTQLPWTQCDPLFHSSLHCIIVWPYFDSLPPLSPAVSGGEEGRNDCNHVHPHGTL